MNEKRKNLYKEIESELSEEENKFHTEFHELIGNKTDEIGILLLCHLLIEYYMDRYILVAYPTIEKYKELSLSFSKKINFIFRNKTIFHSLYEGLNALNRIRNKYAHELKYNLTTKDIEPILKTIQSAENTNKKGIPKETTEIFKYFL